MVEAEKIAEYKEIVQKYIDDVLSGGVPACRWVKLACQRHLDDLDYGPARGLEFKEEKAAHAVEWFSFLTLWKGREYKGKKFVLAPHMMFITWVLMGWYWTDGTRRFRKAYIEMARKGSKSTYAGGLGGYFFVADKEEGAEVYTAAVKKDQAKIVWTNIKNLLRTSNFKKDIVFYTHNLSIDESNSKCEALSSDSKSLDGLDTHFATLDELHAHPTREVYDLIDDSIGARTQPMILIITTAGFNQTGICYETREYLTMILKGTIQDDAFFGIIYTLDTAKDWPDLKNKEDDWTNEDLWVKAAPGLIGVTENGVRFGLDEEGNPIPGYMTKLEDMRNKARIAIQMPSAQNNFLTKRLNIWTQQESRWIDLAMWDRNNTKPVTEERLMHKLCYGGIDLSSVEDLTVWTMLFPDEEDRDLVDILIRIWCPEAKLYDTRNRYREQYQGWAKDGFLLTTPGDAIDFEFVRKQIVEDSHKFGLDSTAIDYQWQGYEFATKLNEELGGGTLRDEDWKVTAMRTGTYTLSPVCQEFERLLLMEKLNHGGNPVLRWMADNVTVRYDANANKIPDRKNSQGKIDGIIGILLALHQHMRARAKETPSETGGVWIFDEKGGEI